MIESGVNGSLLPGNLRLSEVLPPKAVKNCDLSLKIGEQF
jgi:hypothetical protein